MKILKRFYYRIIDSQRLKKAVRQAEHLRLISRHRYYVLLPDDLQPIVVNKYEVKRLRIKGFIYDDVTVIDLVQQSFYYTAYGNGTDPISDDEYKKRRKAYLKKCRVTRENHK